MRLVDTEATRFRGVAEEKVMGWGTQGPGGCLQGVGGVANALCQSGNSHQATPLQRRIHMKIPVAKAFQKP